MSIAWASPVRRPEAEPSAISQVVNGGCCIGCGACAYAFQGAMHIDAAGKYLPVALEKYDEDCFNRICPFSGVSDDEDKLGSDLAGDLPKSPQIGHYRSTLVGYATREDLRIGGSSGGLVTWIACKLKERGEIDRVIHVRGAQHSGVLFQYALSETIADIESGAKSRYYPITMEGVLKEVASVEGRYLLIGLPCFVKAVRLLQQEFPHLRDRIRFCVSIFCGHLKTTAYANYLAAQAGVIHPIQGVDFRKKNMDRRASDYDTEFFTGRDRGPEAGSVVARTASLEGTDWGMGFFKNPACDYCDDIVGEVADASFGDAWLPEFESDPRGASIAITRHYLLDNLILEGVLSGELVMNSISESGIVQSQAANFRHRREGLAYRLWRRKMARLWYPKKRVRARFWHISSNRKRIYLLREVLSQLTNSLYAKGSSLEDIRQKLSEGIAEYRRLYARERRPSMLQQVLTLACRGRVIIGRYRRLFFTKEDQRR